jgi:hypothetical protein
VKGTEAIQNAIANGVSRGELAYVGKTGSGAYKPFEYNKGLAVVEVEISDDIFIITKETADAYIKKLQSPTSEPEPSQPDPTTPTLPLNEPSPSTVEPPATGSTTMRSLKWSGEVPPQKWMNFYTKVLSRFVTASGLKLTVRVEVAPEGGLSKQKLDEARSALRELGLNDDIKEE